MADFAIRKVVTGMCDTCDDSRLELVEKYKQKLLDATNIEDSPEEMAVIDNILFRFWQMGWLNLATDTISRQDAIALLEEAESARLRGDILLFYPVMLNGLKKLPSAQPDIIACGDCKHWICHDRRCGYWNHSVMPLDWCCHAERRSNG